MERGCQLFEGDVEGGGGGAEVHADMTELQDLSARRRQFVTGLAPQPHEVHTARVTELTVKEKDEADKAPAHAPAPAPAPAPPSLALQELTASPRRLAGRPPVLQLQADTEKETTVVKSPSDQRLLYRLQDEDDDDIRFADDGDDDCEDIFCKDSRVDPKTVPLLGKRGDVNV